MCGRATLATPADVIAALYGILPEDMPELSPRYNIAPSQPLLTIRSDEDGRRASIYTWGFTSAEIVGPPGGSRERRLSREARLTRASGPADTRDREHLVVRDEGRFGGSRIEKKVLAINARAETVARLPQFRDAFAKRRCVVPVDGFYEWETIGKRKQPYHFRRPDGQPFSIAGLWTPATDAATAGRVVVLTTTALGEIARIHDRMPVVLGADSVAGWFGSETRFRDLFTMLAAGDGGSMVATPVSQAVNDASYDGPDCIRPALRFLGS